MLGVWGPPPYFTVLLNAEETEMLSLGIVPESVKNSTASMLEWALKEPE